MKRALMRDNLCLTMLAAHLFFSGCGSKTTAGDAETGAAATGGTGDVGSGGAGGGADAGEGGGWQAMLTAATSRWAAAKPACPAYTYRRRHSSVFGWCATTTVEITGDEATARSYASSTNGCDPGADAGLLEQWIETGPAEVGSHADGDPALTVEQLLGECQTILGSDPSRYRMVLQVSAEGVPTTCTATLNQCIDDCTSGIQISAFECAALPASLARP